MSKHVLGWRRDLPDFRDRRAKWGGGFMLPMGLPLPASIDLRPMCSAVENQGQLNSCTGNAIVGALEMREAVRNRQRTDLSRLFVYWNERNYEGTTGQDNGAYIRDGIKCVAALGVCPESVWPYDPQQVLTQPTPDAYTAALPWRVTEYARVSQDLMDIKSVLAAGYPIIFGMSVYDSFESAQVAATGIVPMPGDTETLQGGHAVLAVGYDDAQQAVLVRNSWGAGWGLGGYFWLPYAYITNEDLASDLWVIRN